eukprot:g4870.t1
MKLSSQVFGLFLCLGVLGAYAQSNSSSSGRNSQVQCSAFANLRINLVGPGSCQGSATANCQAVASSQTVIREAFVNWFANDGICDGEKVEAAARAVAEAVASVYTSAIASVSCTGAGGFACGFALGRSDAFAVSFARAIAQASADTGVDTTNAFCVSEIEALGGVIAEAASRSQARACVAGIGSEEAFQEDFTEQVSQVVAQAFASATAIGCSDGQSAANAQATCDGVAIVSPTPGATDIIPCNANIVRACCGTSYRSRVCVCNGCGGAQRRQTNFNDGEGFRTWRTISNGAVCVCV